MGTQIKDGKVYVVISGKGGVGKSLGYSEYVSLANGDVIQIGPYVDSLFSKSKINHLIFQTNSGQEVFEVLEPPQDLTLNIVKQEKEGIISERKNPVSIMRKPAPKSLLIVKTANGKIEVTKEHKFLVLREGNFIKVKAEDLVPKKDYLLAFNYPRLNENFIEGSKDIAKLLGYIIGDGYIEKRRNGCVIHVFCEDCEEKNLSNVKRTFQNVFGGFSLLKDKRNNVCRISFTKQEAIKKIFDEYGVIPATASLKEIPKRIFSLNNLLCAEFLSALFDCDGHVCKKRNEIQYDTKSLKLAYQIANLLRTRYNINCQLKEEYKRASNGASKKEEYFRIIISGEDIRKFYSTIGFKNKFKQDRLKEKMNFNEYNTNIKLFPIGKIIRLAREKCGISAKKLGNLLGVTKQMIYEYEWGWYALSKNSTEKFLNVFKKLGVSNEKLDFIAKIISEGYSFRKVDEIKEINYGHPYVYDFQVYEEGGHFTHGTGIVISNTTSTINLGGSINDLGKEVIIVDANLTTPNIGLHLGSPIVPITLNHVMEGKAKVEEAIYEHESGTKILPSSLSIADLKSIDHDKLNSVVKRLRKIADHIFLDSSAGLGEEAKSALKACDEVIIITNPEISAVTDALKTAKVAEEMDKKVLGVIITRCEGASWEMPIETIKDMLEIPILGVIPEDASVKESQKMKNPVIHTHPKSKAAKAYKKIARRLIGHEPVKKAEDQTKKSEGFFSKLMRRLGL